MAKRLPGIEISDRMPMLKHDPEGDTWVQFQRPARWESEQVSRMASQAETILDQRRGEVRTRGGMPEDTLDSERVSLCLVESNLPDPEGKKVFVPGKTCRQPRSTDIDQDVRTAFYEAWWAMPDNVCDEIAYLLHDFHPPFDWRNPRRGESLKQTSSQRSEDGPETSSEPTPTPEESTKTT